MASRIAASIVARGLRVGGKDAGGGGHAGGVMVARNLEDYYEIARRLATTPYVYETVRSRLIRARHACPLYDASRWVRAWERGLLMLWETREELRAAGGGGGGVGGGVGTSARGVSAPQESY